MNAIWKWAIEPGTTELQMPVDAQVLTVQMQGGAPQLWAKVDPAAPKVTRTFAVYGTGHQMPDDPRVQYVATFQMHDGALVWHVFEMPRAARIEPDKPWARA